MAVDRSLAADVVFLVRDLPGFIALHTKGDRLAVIIDDDQGDIDILAVEGLRHRCKLPPIFVVVAPESKRERFITSYPWLARYFITRPICTDDLVHALL
jgi:hypothetical protein